MVKFPPLILQGVMLEKHHKLQPKPKTTDELQTIWKELPKTQQQGGGELHQAFDCLHGCGRGRHWWSLRASAVTPSISKSASSSHHQ